MAVGVAKSKLALDQLLLCPLSGISAKAVIDFPIAITLNINIFSLNSNNHINHDMHMKKD